ncbi:DUF2947 domain-containing protein [Salinivibrio sp. IB872]|uniref:DUF2947 domain-containing protein n=1 Tax=Salinivibrio sp. IB872 TaxID=1766123 RepID=UPI000987AA7B|nr:DUF2947 domain-containing protein [Salinivibrio sp. IB872]OOF21604.1 hypothetical protein BZJ18_15845 [Salinivibrio sp. IB872]
MNYIPLSDYKRKWIFTHQSLPIAESDLADIKPMTEARAGQLWQEFVSKDSPTPDHFGKQDWPTHQSVWKNRLVWQSAWDNDEDLPDEFLANFPWEDNIVIYFCYDKHNVVESRWGIFKKYWKNFLFYDDKPILLGRRRKEVAMFEQSGEVVIGTRQS